MKSSELSNGVNRIALRQLLQNRKLRHWWRHNLGWRWKLQKMARQNFSIHALYNITKNQHSFLGVTQPQGSHSPYILGDTTRPGHVTCILVRSKSDRRRLKKTAQTNRQTNKQTNKHYENNGHLAVNQYLEQIHSPKAVHTANRSTGTVHTSTKARLTSVNCFEFTFVLRHCCWDFPPIIPKSSLLVEPAQTGVTPKISA